MIIGIYSIDRHHDKPSSTLEGARGVHGQISCITGVTNVKRMKSILLSKEKLCPYIHESLEHHGSPWKLMIAITTGGGE
jgi:hypothetical protein